MKTYKTICPYDCPTTCGLLAKAEGDRIVKVKGDPDDLISRGLICRKMQRYEKSINSPDRIITPLKELEIKEMESFSQFHGMRP